MLFRSIARVNERPRVVSTSRHVTQGIVDLVEEKWDGATKTLSGTSRVVGDDPYELRIVVPEDFKVVSVGTTDVSGGEVRGLGVGTTPQKDGVLRVTITSRTNREVRWSVKF